MEKCSLTQLKYALKKNTKLKFVFAAKRKICTDCTVHHSCDQIFTIDPQNLSRRTCLCLKFRQLWQMSPEDNLPASRCRILQHHVFHASAECIHPCPKRNPR